MSGKLSALAQKYGYEHVLGGTDTINVGVNHANFYVGAFDDALFKCVRVSFNFKKTDIPDYIIVDPLKGTGRSTKISFFPGRMHHEKSSSVSSFTQGSITSLQAYANYITEQSKWERPVVRRPLLSVDVLLDCFSKFDARIESGLAQYEGLERAARHSEIWKPL